MTSFDALFNSFVWIGASDAAAEGATEANWEWVVGPEAGLQFWQFVPPDIPEPSIWAPRRVWPSTDSGATPM